MKFSVIIPVHNAQNTLRPCLDAIFSSDRNDLEVIVVDDNSVDRSFSIARKYPCRIEKLDTTRGAAAARNIGESCTRGEILVFIDADVVIKNDTFDTIDRTFNEYTDIVAVTGILSKKSPYVGFFSQYKNTYR